MTSIVLNGYTDVDPAGDLVTCKSSYTFFGVGGGVMLHPLTQQATMAKSSTEMEWLMNANGWVLWYINNCRLFIAKSIFMHINDSISNNSVSIDRTQSGATTLGHSGPESNGIKGVLRITQSSSITKASPSDCLVS